MEADASTVGRAVHTTARPGLSWRATDLTEAEQTLPRTWPHTIRPPWDEGSTGAGVRVCVVDSGVAPDHPLVGPVSAAHVVTPGPDGRLRVVTDEPGDAYGHGTACAGVIRSLAPGCSLVSLRVLGAGLSCTGNTLLTGLSWAVEQGFDIVNISLSTTKRELRDELHDLADRACFGGTLLVAAANNRRIESFPWRFASVLSAGRHAVADPRHLLYNPRPPVEFYARGTDVPAPWPGGGTRLCSGNSVAAAHLTGLCALLLSRYPGLTPFQVRSMLQLLAANVGRGREPIR
ncbi:S8 family peptidase [Streptomyces sp. NPDC101225]|uniref:S8 family peptidase n=1 Tax=Streptomyces sp. NPDC101225 TaxID=3366135 RepID=UPI003829B786